MGLNEEYQKWRKLVDAQIALIDAFEAFVSEIKVMMPREVERNFDENYDGISTSLLFDLFRDGVVSGATSISLYNNSNMVVFISAPNDKIYRLNLLIPVKPKF